jgi:SAM-dependent methyltransferase
MNRPASAGLLGDTAARDYAWKLRLFNAYAAPELRQAIASLQLQPGQRVLDAGCGTGEALGWLADAVGRAGLVVGMDLARAHTIAARAVAPADAPVMQANLAQLPLTRGSLDLVWSVNTINHLHDPVGGLRDLTALLRPGGRIALGQSSLLADMYFAWDARLERLVNEAVRQYYRDRYRVSERALADVRALAGRLRQAGLRNVGVRTFMIERLAPLTRADEDYLLEVIFRGSWGERLRPYLTAEDYEELARLCDPEQPGYALRRPDFHFLQSFTLAVGGI